MENKKIPLEVAELKANNLLVHLLPWCTKIEIAGSIRRGREMVKDIEIVCVPKTTHLRPDLFGSPVITRIPDFSKAVMLCGRRIKGDPKDGRYVKMCISQSEEIYADIFITNERDFYRQFAIRTGPAEYSHKVIARAWVAKGWTGASELRMTKELNNPPHDGKYTLPPAWASEREFFEWLGIEYVAPKDRIFK